MSSQGDRPAAAHGRTVGAGALMILGGNAVNVLAGVALGVVVARVLGPEGTGAFNLIGATQFILVALATLGVGVGGQYYVSRGEWPVADAMRQTQVAAAAIGLITAGIGLLLALVLVPGVYEQVPLAGVLVGMLAVPFLLSWTYSSQVAVGHNRQEPSAIAYGGGAVLTLVLVAVLAPTTGVVGTIAGAAGAQVLVAAYILGPWSRRNVPKPSADWLKRSGERLRGAAAYGLRAYVPAALQILNYRGDLLVLSASASAASVGHYSVALSAALLGAIVPRSLATVTAARVAGLSSAGADWENRMVTRKAISHGFLLSGGLALVLAAGAPLMPLVYGQSFEAATELLWLLVPSVLGTGTTTVVWAILNGMGRPSLSMRAAIMTTVAAVGLYLTLIPAYGATGAAIASSISQLAGAAVTMVLFRGARPDIALRELIPGRNELRDYTALLRAQR